MLIHASVLYILWVGVLSHLSIMNVVLAAVASAGIAVRIYAEEHHLVVRHPEYVAYAARTKRVLPFVI